MSYGIKKVNVDENNIGFALSTKVVGEGSLFKVDGSDYVLQENLSNGVGIFLVDVDESAGTGVLTVNLPDSILENTDDNFELDSNGDITPKT